MTQYQTTTNHHNIDMDTTPKITKIERIDDIPLLIKQMEKMQLAQLLDKHFPTHGNWQGLSLGQIVIVWLSYILSQGDHRLNSVQSWAAGILMTLTIYLHATGIRELDFSDDRLCKILDHLGNDESWETYERDQNSTLIRVYDLKSKRTRIDSTTAKSYTNVTEDGLFQFGHSKEHRSDLPQLKINQSVLDPLGLPLTTTIVSGNCADDPLYVPEIHKIQANFNQQGMLYVGDCKMAALETRAYIAASHDYYLCPLSSVQMPAKTLKSLIMPVWAGEQELIPVHRAPTTAADKPIHIANGFSYNIKLTDKNGFQWTEQRLIVQSLKYAKAQEKALNKRLKQAEQEINDLNLRGRGRKRLRPFTKKIIPSFGMNQNIPLWQKSVASQSNFDLLHRFFR
jgi:transposase